MPAIIAGRAGAVWGLTEQSGLIFQSCDSDITIEENPTRNGDGEESCTYFYNPTRKIEVSGIYTGVTQYLGFALVIGYLTAGQQSLGGTPYAISVSTRGAGTEFVSVHITAKQRNLF